MRSKLPDVEVVALSCVLSSQQLEQDILTFSQQPQLPIGLRIVDGSSLSSPAPKYRFGKLTTPLIQTWLDLQHQLTGSAATTASMNSKDIENAIKKYITDKEVAEVQGGFDLLYAPRAFQLLSLVERVESEKESWIYYMCGGEEGNVSLLQRYLYSLERRSTLS